MEILWHVAVATSAVLSSLGRIPAGTDLLWWLMVLHSHPSVSKEMRGYCLSFFSVLYQFPDTVTSIYHIHIFTTILSALLSCNVVRDDYLKCCLLYSQFFMQFKMNTYLWFILSCTHPGQSQQPNLTAWNVCQFFPPFSGNSLLPSSAVQVCFGFLWVLYPCLWKCHLAGNICWRSHRLFFFPHDEFLKYLSLYSFMPFLQRTSKA